MGCCMDNYEQLDINKIASDLLDRNVEKIYSKFEKLIKGEIKKTKIDFNIAFKAYLKNAYDKYSKIKTLLYRTEPKYLYDFFECNTLQHNKKRIDPNDISSVLNISQFIIIQGTGGIGKTTLFRHFFIDELKSNDLIPVFVELKDLNKEKSTLYECIYETLCLFGFNLEREYFAYALRTGCFLLLLDGLDEVSSKKYRDTMNEINKFCDQYSNNYFFISSRPCDDFIALQRFTILNSLPFTKDQAIRLIEKLEYDTMIKKRFVCELNQSLYEKHKSFASNPLLLNIMLMTYNNYAEIPEKLHIFYENAFETMYTKHDATKNGYRREMKSALSYDNFKRVLSKFCFITYIKHKLEFSYDEIKKLILEGSRSLDFDFDVIDYIEDLINAICVIYLDGNRYLFSHRSFQEYFTALYLKDLSDESQTKASLYLISRFSIKEEKVLPMFYDMVKERFERNVIIPILKELEEDIHQCDRYDFFLNKLVDGVVFQIEEDMIKLAYIEPKDGKDAFIFDFANKYYRIKSKEIKLKNIDKTIFDKTHTIKKSKEKAYEYQSFEILENNILNLLVRESWIGETILKTCTFLDQIVKKQSQLNTDLDQLLFMYDSPPLR